MSYTNKVKNTIKHICYSIKTVLVLLAMVWSVQTNAININTANANELSENLKGVGPVLAEKIIAYRELNGDFNSIDDFIEVKGVGRSIVENNFDNISFEDNETMVTKE